MNVGLDDGWLLNVQHSERRRCKSASDLNRYYKGQHEFRRKTILCRSPLPSSTQGGNLKRQGDRDTLNKRKFSSLPHQYRHRPVKRVPEVVTVAASGVTTAEFKRRMDTLRSWMEEFSDAQKTGLVSTVLPFLGSPQMHYLASQLSADSLHHLCPPGCSDPFSLLPLHITYQILRLLPPRDLATVGRVCSSWRHHSLAPSLWENLSNSYPWKLSSPGCALQLERWAGAETSVDWRQVFVERYKLRRAWLGGQCHVRTFEGHSGGISCVQFDGSRIVSGSHDATIKVWNVKTNSPWSVMTLVGHSGEVRCLHLEGNRLVSGSTDLSIKVWDLSIHSSWSSIACRVTMVGHTDTVRCVHMSQATDTVVSGSYDTTLKVWQLKTGVCVATLRGHTGPVLAIQVQANRLVSGSGDRTIRLWHLDTGFCAAELSGHRDAVTCLSLPQEGRQVISGSLDRTIKVWSLVSLTCQHTLDWMSSEGHTGVVRCIQADQWRILSAADDKTIKVWNLATGKRLVTLRSHTDGVTCLQFNDFYVVSGSYDKTVKLWDFTVC